MRIHPIRTALAAALVVAVLVWVAVHSGEGEEHAGVAPTSSPLPSVMAAPEDARVPSVRTAATRPDAADSGAPPEPETAAVAQAAPPAAPALKIVDELTGLPVPGAWAKVLWTRDSSLASGWTEVPLVADSSGGTFPLPQLEPPALYNAGALVGGGQHAPQWKFPLWYTNERFQSAELSLLRGGGISLDVSADQPLPGLLTVQQDPLPPRQEFTKEWPVLGSGRFVAPVHGWDPVILTVSERELGLEGEVRLPVPPAGVVPFGSLFLETSSLLPVRVLRSSGEPLTSQELIFSKAPRDQATARTYTTDDQGILVATERDLRERDITTDVHTHRLAPSTVDLRDDGATIVFPMSLMWLEADDILRDPIEYVVIRTLGPSLQPDPMSSSGGVTSLSKPSKLVRERVGLYVVAHTHEGRRLAALLPPESVVGDFTARLEEHPPSMGSLRVDCSGLELGPEERVALNAFHNQAGVAHTVLRPGQSEWYCGGLLPGDYTIHARDDSGGYTYVMPPQVHVTLAAGATTHVTFPWQRGGRLRLLVREESAEGTPPTEWSARLRDSTGQWRELQFVLQMDRYRTTIATMQTGTSSTVHGIVPAGPALLEVREVSSGTTRTQHAFEVQPGETLSVELTL